MKLLILEPTHKKLHQLFKDNNDLSQLKFGEILGSQ